MNKHKYKKLESSDIRGICVKCQKNPQKKKPNNKYHALCSPCNKREFSPESKRRNAVKATDKQKRPYRHSVGNCCEKCGFIPEHICQLDVDHIDGNHHNNDPSNWQTLCANCHRLKTYLQGKIKTPSN